MDSEYKVPCKSVCHIFASYVGVPCVIGMGCTGSVDVHGTLNWFFVGTILTHLSLE